MEDTRMSTAGGPSPAQAPAQVAAPEPTQAAAAVGGGAPDGKHKDAAASNSKRKAPDADSDEVQELDAPAAKQARTSADAKEKDDRKEKEKKRKRLEDWENPDVLDWAASLPESLKECVKHFRNHRTDGQTLLDIEAKDLADLEVKSVHRSPLWKEIMKLRNEDELVRLRTQQPPPPPDKASNGAAKGPVAAKSAAVAKGSSGMGQDRIPRGARATLKVRHTGDVAVSVKRQDKPSRREEKRDEGTRLSTGRGRGGGGGGGDSDESSDDDDDDDDVDMSAAAAVGDVSAELEDVSAAMVFGAGSTFHGGLNMATGAGARAGNTTSTTISTVRGGGQGGVRSRSTAISRTESGQQIAVAGGISAANVTIGNRNTSVSSVYHRRR